MEEPAGPILQAGFNSLWSWCGSIGINSEPKSMGNNWLRTLCRSGLLIVLTFVGFQLKAATLDISTTTVTNWRVTVGGAVNAVPYPFGTELSISSTGTGVGTFVSGGSFNSFSGFWLAN